MQTVKVIESFATSREQQQHQEAVMAFGEIVTVRRRWTVDDFDAALVTRCTQCAAGSDSSLQARYQAVYKQSGDTYCSNCFGTGFDGGFQPVIYMTWALVTDEPEEWQKDKTGEFQPRKPTAQLLWEPHLARWDILARFDGWSGDTPGTELNRYQFDQVERVMPRTGPRPAPPAGPLSGAVGVTDALIVAQMCRMENLPQQHPLLQVEMRP